eukprot:1196174-Prorocentrum_minimum.AAC.7
MEPLAPEMHPGELPACHEAAWKLIGNSKNVARCGYYFVTLSIYLLAVGYYYVSLSVGSLAVDVTITSRSRRAPSPSVLLSRYAPGRLPRRRCYYYVTITITYGDNNLSRSQVRVPRRGIGGAEEVPGPPGGPLRGAQFGFGARGGPAPAGGGKRPHAGERKRFEIILLISAI